MKKANFTNCLHYCWVWLLFLIPYLSYGQIPGLPTISCGDPVISLGDEMGPDMMAPECGCVTPNDFINQGELTPMPAYWLLYLDGVSSSPFNTTAPELDACFEGITEEVLGWWDYEIHAVYPPGTVGDPPNTEERRAKCWGHVTFEDKVPPDVSTCPTPPDPLYVYKYDWPKVKSLIEEFKDGFGCAYFDSHCNPMCDPDEGIDDVTVAYIPFNGVGTILDQSGDDVENDEECMWVGLMSSPGTPTSPGTPITDEDFEYVWTAEMLERSGCVTDNCQQNIQIKGRIVEVQNPYECPPPNTVMAWYRLEYYIEWTSAHLGTQEEIVTYYDFHVLRPPMPEWPHNVTVYCGYGADEDGVQIDKTPEGIAKQYTYAAFCGEDYFQIWEEACDYDELHYLDQGYFADGECGINYGARYAYPHWVDHDGCVIPLKPGDTHGYCKYFSVYEDQPLLEDCCVYKLLRKWTVVDWCTSRAEDWYQVVERHDHKGPELHGDKPYPVEVGIKPWLCYAETYVPDSPHYPYIEAWDACCDAGVYVSVHEFVYPDVVLSEGFPDMNEQQALSMPAEEFDKYFGYYLCDFAGPSLGEDYEHLSIGDPLHLPQGKYILKYQAVDECGNYGEYFCSSLWVLDKTPPVPVCEDEVVVSLTPDNGLLDGGIAKAFATSFNNHSHDAGCGDVWYGIMRMDDFNTEKVYDCYGYFVGWEGGSCQGANQNIAYYPMDGYDKNGYPECDDDYALATNFCHVYSPYGQDLKFCCEDYGNDELWVVMRVWDEGHFNPEAFTEHGYPHYYGKGGYSGKYGAYMNEYGYKFFEHFPAYHGYTSDGYEKWVWNPYYGNYNDCMVKVTIQNKISATIICAKNTFYYCDQYPDTPQEAYAHAPTVDALCGDVDMEYYDIVDLDDCQFGVVYRVWTAYAGEEVVASCTQHIYIGAHDVFDPRSIKWPPHQTGEKIWAYQIECVYGYDHDYYDSDEYGHHYYDHKYKDDDYHPAIVDYLPATLPPHLDCAEAETCLPEWDDTSCGLIGWSLDADTIYFEDESCIKIINNWTIIDWCVWRPNCDDDYDEVTDNWAWFEDWSLGDCTKQSCYDDDPENDGNAHEPDEYNLYASFVADCTIQYGYNSENNDDCETDHGNFGYYLDCTYYDDGGLYEDEIKVDGYYVWKQVIKVINTTPPVLADCEDKEFEVDADCYGHLVLENTATDEGDCGSKWLKWHIELFDVHWHLIDYWDIYSGSGETVRIDDDNEPDGWDYDTDEELHQPPGTYIVRWTVSDGCNNEAVCIQYLQVVDRKPPTPICFGTISTALMQPSGEVTIWATDFEQKSFDNCTEQEDLEYDIKLADSDDDPSASIDIDCETLTTNPLTLQMYVTDEQGNSDWCEVFLFVSDETGICGVTGSGTAMVSGRVATEFGEMIEGAMVSIEGLGGSHRYNMMTAGDGQYAFANNPMYQDYTVMAIKDGDDMNGVSTLDLVLMSRHITGSLPLASPYKVIAADVNSDEDVTTMDIVELRKLILGKYAEMPENTSWRFVDASQQLDASDPFPFAEVIKIENLESDRQGEDFIGVKIGDVNESVKANEANQTEVRTEESLTLSVEDASVDAGEMIRIDVRADNFNNVYGYQFTMNHSGMTLQSVEAGALDVSDANVGVREGLLTMSWNETGGVSTTDVLFSLTFLAESSVTLSDVLNISSNVTTAEAYVGAGMEAQDVNLVFRTEEGTLEAAVFELYQNEPNPFDNETLISFTLPKAAGAMITIMDLAGKTVKVIQGEYGRGYNEIILKSEELGAGGVYYYQLESGEFSSVKKMVLIN